MSVECDFIYAGEVGGESLEVAKGGYVSPSLAGTCQNTPGLRDACSGRDGIP